ncbi:PIN-like domain-containing protein [Nocardia mangyaensis]|uniref:PIN-like domain-containing protein n=1 Tax=Nocardia mangyaensis TaxID=2213200 RepID=UPI0026766220|nr:PIN-like domain-containing protein [Nocardia mangyaensis]MDO3648732.1 PIN domain-containing protein [Nocardia mangyaensis]
MTRGGLFTGFEEYQVAAAAEKQTALKGALVAVDTNVLLDLYRYNRSTSDELLTVIESLRDRLFVPHQVVHEFWRNRLSVINGLGSATTEAHGALSKNKASTQNAIRTWAKRTALDETVLAGLLDVTDAFFEDLKIRLAGEPSSVSPDLVAGSDWLLGRLDALLSGRVGPALPADEWRSAVDEGRRRVDSNEPPGYRDQQKVEHSALPEGASGDYLVWRQLLIEGARQKTDLVLVLADTKDDWWWIEKGKHLGPRRELVSEYLRETGCKVYFFTPADLLQQSSVLGLGTSEESVADIERVQREDEALEPPRPRRARSVHIIIDNDLIEAGTLVELDLQGILNPTAVEQVREWIAQDPDRGHARWTDDRNRPLTWSADPDGEGWSPTSLAQHIIAMATGSTERRTIAGPDVWVVDGYSLYAIASSFLSDTE